MHDAKPDGRGEGAPHNHRRILEDARLPRGMDDRGKTVSERCLKRVLESIASFGPTCWASVRTIGCKKDYGERQTRSAIQALIKLDLLLTAEGKRSRSSPFPIVEKQIVYIPNLARHCSDDLQTRFGQLPFVPVPWRMATQAALLPTQPALLPTQPAPGADPACTECHLTQNETQKELKIETQFEAERPVEFANMHQAAWPNLQIFDLRNPNDVSSVHELLAAKGLVIEGWEGLELCMYAAVVTVRRARRNPHGHFRTLIENGFGMGLSDTDRARAKDLLRELQGYDTRRHAE